MTSRYAPDTAEPGGLWQDAATCRTLPPTWWDPDADTTHTPVAIAICRECPVREQCLRAAMRDERGAQAHDRGCIWGGYLPEERADLYQIRQRRRAARRQQEHDARTGVSV